ncbi:MAG: stage 0 sporulation family protein [Desulfuromonadales bacterium]|nr:stage 0 sporulation family protein [Desulfuromonadales bacterium]
MTQIVTLKFRIAGKQYDFNAKDLLLKKGDRVIVETDRGRALAIVVVPPVEKDESQTPKGLKAVLRVATDEDLAMSAANASREETALHYCRERIRERNLEMKLVKAEYLFDGSKIVFYFTADGRIDFRELVKDLAQHFHTRIEMRQIGVRDEAKLIGGMGICGRELCCCSYMTEFSPVSVKMAKEQQLALNPNKISGQCGRLLCCLGYEYETYCRQRKGMPKNGHRMDVDGHETRVSDTDVLRQQITLRVDDGRSFKLTKDEFVNLQQSDAKFPESDSAPQSIGRPERKPAPARTETQGKGRVDRPTRRKPRGSSSTNENQKAKAAEKQPDLKTAQKPQGPGKAVLADTETPSSASKRRRRRRNRRRPKPEGSAE